MIADVHIPYGFGDCVNGYKYEGVIASNEYVKKMVSDYNYHKYGIDEMMTRQHGHNMAMNVFNKEARKYRQMNVELGILRAYIDTKDFDDMTLDELLRHYENDVGFPIIVRIADKRH